MSQQSSGLYDGVVDEPERKRLETFSYPHGVSLSVLGDVHFGSLIDAGAGPDIRLARYVVQDCSASYIAFDQGKTMVGGVEKSFADIMREKLAHEHIRARVYQADICNIPPEIGRADVVHERFVLMHLDEEHRQIAFRQLMNVAISKVILLEYDWSTMQSFAYRSTTMRFVKLSFQLMESFRIDPFAGRTMQSLVRELGGSFRFEFRTFSRPEGNYSGELVQLCDMQSGLARRIGNDSLADQFEAFGRELKLSPIVFVPPSIIAAIITV